MFSDSFFNLTDRAVVLYGVSSYFGKRCHEYLKKIGFAQDQIIGFIDRDVSKHGHFFDGKTIYSPDYLKNRPDVIVIISAGQLISIYRDIQKLGIKNSVYAFMDFTPAYPSDTSQNIDVKFTESFYDDYCSYTHDIIEAVHYIRDNNCRIQPIESAIKFSIFGSGNYWSDKNIPYLNYDQITICDAGAYIGDSLAAIHEEYGSRIKHYFAFEPDISNFNILKETTNRLNLNDIVTLYQCGLSDSDKEEYFVNDGVGSHSIITPPHTSSRMINT
jgi:hypothetical protein